MTRVQPKDIQLTGIKHAKEAIAGLLNEQSDTRAELERLLALNAELRRVLQQIVTFTEHEEGLAGGLGDIARAAIAKATQS